MKLTVTTLSDDLYAVDVSDDMELENFKALLEFESNIPASEMMLLWNGRPMLENKRKLSEFGLKEGEMLLLQRVQPGSEGIVPRQQLQPTSSSGAGGLPQIDFGNIQIPLPGSSSGRQSAAPAGAGMEDPATLRDLLLNSPRDVALLKERNPPLAEALLSGNLEKFTEVLRRQQNERAEREMERIRMLSADPFDAEAQKKIAEEIRLKNVESNMETAMEFAPESFGQVVMLYIDCKVNGNDVKAFVDSGAQMTIMSKECAERCNIMRLVDSRWAGIAKGVGTQRIIGKVHSCQIQLSDVYLQSSFSILEDQPMDMLLGLDMLKRHQCCLDLKRNMLVIGTTGTEIPFLGEGELPAHARLNRTISGVDIDDDRQLAEALSRSATEAVSATNPSASTESSNFPEENVRKLMQHGFSRQQVIAELQAAKGDMDQALAALFAKSLQFP